MDENMESVLKSVNDEELAAAAQQARGRIVPSIVSAGIQKSIQGLQTQISPDERGRIDDEVNDAEESTYGRFDAFVTEDDEDDITLGLSRNLGFFKNRTNKNMEWRMDDPEPDYGSSLPRSGRGDKVIESHIFNPLQSHFTMNPNPFTTPRRGYNDLSTQPSTSSNHSYRLTGNVSNLPRDERQPINARFSSSIEMTSFPPKSSPSNGGVRFHGRSGSDTSFTTFQEYDPLTLSDLSKLPELNLETILDCIEKRYKHDLIYTQCGEILISLNPFKHLELCTYKYFKGYTPSEISNTPHLFAVSAKAYQSIIDQNQNQVILVSGESGAGKTEATKLLVRHLTFIAGSEDPSLHDKIIEINPLLEAFGNAKTKLNTNSSRFAKFLTLSINLNGKIESARVKDYMLEKSRVVHQGPRERNFHFFYALLVGASDRLLESLHIRRGDRFRITGDFTSPTGAEKTLYQKIYENVQAVFQLIKLSQDDIQDINTILSAILHLGNIEFEESDNDSVVIKDETIVHKVATLLQLDVEQLTRALIERKGRLGKDHVTFFELKAAGQGQKSSIMSRDSISVLRTASRGNKLENEMFGSSRDYIRSTELEAQDEGEIIELSKNKKQADDERDATAKSLYERMFGWLVRKINDSLRPKFVSNLPNIGILDICGFENMDVNSFEQLCINVVNEQLQNFMNKTVIEKDVEDYRLEGIDIGDVQTESINNDDVLNMFMEKPRGIMALIDEASKVEISNNFRLVNNLTKTFGNNGIFIPPAADVPEFKIKHFASEVSYDARSFIQKNRDTLSEAMKECLRQSGTVLIQDLFSVKESESGSISMADYHFVGGSRKPSVRVQKPVIEGNLSQSINRSRTVSLQQKFGNNHPNLKSGDFAKRSTHITFFRNSMNDLLRAMKEAHPFFVRCIKPNDMQAAGVFVKERVKTQLQYNGVQEIARIRNFKFPFRLSKEEFRQKYEILADKKSKSDLFHGILQSVNADNKQFKVGFTKIFMSETVKDALDSAVNDSVRAWYRDDSGNTSVELGDYPDGGNTSQWPSTVISAQAEQLKRELREPAPLTTIEERSVDGSVYGIISSSRGNRIPEVLKEEKSDESESDSEDETSVKSLFDEDRIVEAWDMTQELTVEEERHDVHEQPVLMFVKVLVYIIIFIILLGTFVIQKVSFLLLTTKLKSQTTSQNQSGMPKHCVLVEEHQKYLHTITVVLVVTAICIPYALGWCITVAKLFFGNFKRPSLWTWIWVFIMENLHIVGLCLLVFRVLPQQDIIRSAMLLNATAFLPAILKLTMSSSSSPFKKKQILQCSSPLRKFFRVCGDVLALLGQLSVFPLIFATNYFQEGGSISSEPARILEFVGTFVLVSFAHWENFVDGRFFCELGATNSFKNAMLKIRYELQNGRHYPHVVTYLSKIGITVLMAFLLHSDDVDIVKSFAALTQRKNPIDLENIVPVIVLTIAAFIAFYVSFGACMFQMQAVSLAIPALLATPATITIFYLDCKYKFLRTFTCTDAECHDFDVTKEWNHYLFGAVWWISFLLLSRHLWTPWVDRTANMARVFIDPIYCGILTTESVMLNRIRNPTKVREERKGFGDGEDTLVYYKLSGKLGEDDDADPEMKESKKEEKDKQSEDNSAIPMLYACATMWHETRTEMVQLLKSIHRLDRDQFIRRLANENVKGYDPDFYNFEAHIFFDDAMEPDDNDEQVPNGWVKELVSCMDVACSSVHGKPIKVHPPTKVPTPYGGQLIWQMPGENLLFVHMKDVTKIRNRKRWSQVMYMYYLLGYRHIMASKQDLLEKMKELNKQGGYKGLNIHEINYLLGEQTAAKAMNTFLLALDGDTDFSPGSIKILLDRMKDENVGAACGRIHPIGNGPMIWYQKFEYAIGHWLQKAAEHVFGCVLCSPGCFSLFRASALMDTNVMKKYTTEPTEPGHHLQFDQGEDRWLCTLMLQQGYRIEYAAAADAWTFAPEGFFEFFNQRRRWMPSTIANILDLLGSSTVTCKRNANMSKLYFAYQWLLMLMTVLGPGTIIMMIAGASKLVFKFSLVEAYIFSTVPAALFTVACFWFKSRIQLILAAILSVIYTFIMMIVLVGTIITATTENIFHPSVIVIVMLMGIFIISGLCHPQEVSCLLHGVLYLLTIPSGYLLLVIYSICNLNDVSWGTREVPTKAQRIEMEKKKKEKEEQEKNKPKRGVWAKMFNRGEEHIRELTKLVKTLLPQRVQSPQEQLGLAGVDIEGGAQSGGQVIEFLAKIGSSLESIEQLLKKDGQGIPVSDQQTSAVVQQPKGEQQLASIAASIRPLQGILKDEKVPGPADDGNPKKRKKRRNDLRNPLWAKDKGLGNGVKILGNKQEIKFWQEFVTKYLLPIRPSPEEKKKIADGLRDLRNSSTFAFIILNLLWMALNFMFQLTNAARFSITYSYSGNSYKIEESILGMGFVFLLLLLLLIQMFGMFIHRMGTLQQLIAITEIKIGKSKEGAANTKRDREAAIRRIKEVLKLPMLGDAGTETLPPVPLTRQQGGLGMTVAKHSSRGFDQSSNQFIRTLNQTIKHPMFSNLTSDVTKDSTSSFRQRLATGATLQELRNNDLMGKSFRPRLPPPRVKSFHQPMMSQPSRWGFTQRQLRNANIDFADADDNSAMKDLGAMGKSLQQRFRVINDEIRKTSVTVSDNSSIIMKPAKRNFIEF